MSFWVNWYVLRALVNEVVPDFSFLPRRDMGLVPKHSAVKLLLSMVSLLLSQSIERLD